MKIPGEDRAPRWPGPRPDPRPGLIKRYEEILADALKRSEAVFDLRPKAPCVVKREPPFTEKSAAAHKGN